MKKFLFLWLFLAVLFAACTDDDDNVGEIPTPEVNKVQMIVVNEGLFGTVRRIFLLCMRMGLLFGMLLKERMGCLWEMSPNLSLILMVNILLC